MGKIAAFVIGLFVIGAGYGVTALKDLLGNVPEGAPVDYMALIDLASNGFKVIGALLIVYVFLAVIWGIIRANHRRRKERKQQAKMEQRQREEQRRPASEQYEYRDDYQRQPERAQQREPPRNPPQDDGEWDTTNPEEVSRRESERDRGY